MNFEIDGRRNCPVCTAYFGDEGDNDDKAKLAKFHNIDTIMGSDKAEAKLVYELPHKLPAHG